MAAIQLRTAPLALDDKYFYHVLGQRIARFRKARGLTQQQLAQILGIAQQTVAHYEGGRLRIAVALLPTLTQALEITVEELLEETPKAAQCKRRPVSALDKQIERINQLPRAKQKAVLAMLDTVIQQAS